MFAVSKWLESEACAFNQTFDCKDAGTPLAEFLVVAARRGAAIYRQALQEVTRQVRRSSVRAN